MKKKIRWSSLLVSLVVAAVVLICPTFLNRYSLGVVNTALIYGMAGWGISVLLGMGGQLSFASISFMGIGGYAVANFCTGRLPFTLPPLAALFASLVVCGIFAWVLGLILFKLKGTYFTFATIALVQVAFTFFNNYRPSTPQISPYGHPHASPHSSTGMCIGRKIIPAFAIAWNAIGSTTHSAMHSAQNARFFAFTVFFMGKLLLHVVAAIIPAPAAPRKPHRGLFFLPAPCISPAHPL